MQQRLRAIARSPGGLMETPLDEQIRRFSCEDEAQKIFSSVPSSSMSSRVSPRGTSGSPELWSETSVSRCEMPRAAAPFIPGRLPSKLTTIQPSDTKPLFF